MSYTTSYIPVSRHSLSSAAYVAHEEACAAILSSTWKDNQPTRINTKPIIVSSDGMQYQATITPPSSSSSSSSQEQQETTSPTTSTSTSTSQSQPSSSTQPPQSLFSNFPIPPSISHPFLSHDSFTDSHDSHDSSSSDDDMDECLSIEEQEKRYWASIQEEQKNMNEQEKRRRNRDPPRTPAENEARNNIISVLGCVLEQVFCSSDQLELPPPTSQTITLFHTERIPTISIRHYFERIAKYGDCSTSCLVLSLIHINRILHSRPQFHINAYNIHRLLLTSVLCSAKFFDDHYFNNAFYAKVGGIPCRELNFLEIEFLALINFDLHVKTTIYNHFLNELCSYELHDKCECQHASIPRISMDEQEPIYIHPMRVMSPDGTQPHRLNKKPMKYTTWAQAVATTIRQQQLSQSSQQQQQHVPMTYTTQEQTMTYTQQSSQTQHIQQSSQQLQQQQRTFMYHPPAQQITSFIPTRKTPPLAMPTPCSPPHPHIDTESISPTLSCSSTCSTDSPTPSMSSSTSSLVSLSASSCSASSSAASTPQNIESPMISSTSSHKRRAGVSFTFQPNGVIHKNKKKKNVWNERKQQSATMMNECKE